ncbi:hypothetical protein ACFUTX_00770 [Microbacterium sp. NPDC057407]|uniref:hypothetical protein n=1 Tax=Microbacterium sp. NPDC057407 TaxID=3346120 RepID=UPI00366A8DF6
MTSRTTTPLRDSAPVPVPAKLAAAWTSFMFLYIYVDYYHLYKPGSVDDILSGVVFEFDISPLLLTAFLGLVSLPALMIAASVALPPAPARVASLAIASLYVPVTLFNAVGESWEWAPFYALSIGVELLLLTFILRTAWRWPRTADVAAPAAVAGIG